jgi:hypothetical protein
MRFSATRFAVTAILLVATVASGCASLGAPTDITPQVQCERYGGLWRPALNFCETSSGRG